MAKDLIIVESPAKVKTISKFLGSGYTVEASKGHVRDLPTRVLGVDEAHDFAPQYEIVDSRKDVVEKSFMNGFISVIVVLVIVVLSSVSLFFLYRLYVGARMAAARNAYIMAMVEYLRLKSVLLALPMQDTKLLEDLTKASANLASMQKDRTEPASWGLSDKLLLSPLILELHRIASKSRSATISQLSELNILAKEEMPRFLDAIAPLCPHEDTKVFYTCLLLRLRFSLSEICCLLDIRSQNLYTIRRRLYRKLHGSDGKACDFDDEIRKMPC